MSAGRGGADTRRTHRGDVGRVGGAQSSDPLEPTPAVEHVEHRRDAECECLAQVGLGAVRQMHVRVDEAGEERAAAAVDDLRARRDGELRPADVTDHAVSHDDAAMLGDALAVEQAYVVDDERPLRRRASRSEREDPQQHANASHAIADSDRGSVPRWDTSSSGKVDVGRRPESRPTFPLASHLGFTYHGNSRPDADTMPRLSRLQSEIKQRRPFRSRGQEATIALLRTASVVGRAVARVVEPSGLSLAQYNALRIIRGAGVGGIPTLSIRERMIDEGTTITR